MSVAVDSRKEGCAASPAPPETSSSNWRRRALPALIFTIVLTQPPFVATLVISFHELERLLPRRARIRRSRQLPPRVHRRGQRRSVVTTIVLTATVVIVSLLRGWASPCCWTASSSPGRGAHDDDRAVPLVPVAAALLGNTPLQPARGSTVS